MVFVRRHSDWDFSVAKRGICDLLCGLAGRYVGGVDNFGVVMQPRSCRLGIWLQVRQSERRGTEDFVVLYTVTERVLLGAEDKMLDLYAVPCKVIADFPPEVLSRGL
jgi:hypothetical protein